MIFFKRCAVSSWFIFVLCGLLLPIGAEDKAPQATKLASHKVPYQLTDTKHILVRVKIDGKGPFNFIMDTGAPAVFVATHVAKKVGLAPNERGWTTCERFEVEGGVHLEKVRVRIEDPFQLTGMNRMNLAGFRLDGILGYTMLAQFRIQYDFTRPHLVWTKLDWTPPWPQGLAEMGGKEPKELQAMGSLVNFASALVGRRPDPEYVPRGFLGIDLEDSDAGVRISHVLAGSPAGLAGLRKADCIVSFQRKAVKDVAELVKLAANVPAGDDAQLIVQRGEERITFTVKSRKAI